jgi:hypothetical protein
MKCSGGLVTYLRRDLCCNDTFVFGRHDTHLWVKISGELFNIDGHLFSALCYSIHIYSLLEKPSLPDDYDIDIQPSRKTLDKSTNSSCLLLIEDWVTYCKWSGV